MEKFTTQLRVRHYEMDALGHVNNAIYQHYLEQAAIEHCEAAGFPLERYAELGGVFVMRRLEIEYLRPAMAGNTLLISTWIGEMRGVRSIRHYEIFHNDELLVTANAVWVWVESATMRPRPVPKVFMEALSQWSQNALENRRSV